MSDAERAPLPGLPSDQGRHYERALNPALHGCETFDFAPHDLPALRAQLSAYPAFSIHAPLPTPPDYPGKAVTSFLLDPDRVRRKASLDALERTIDMAAAWGARYVVVHFAGLHSDGMSTETVSALADETAAQLSAWAQAAGVSLHIEYAAYNPHFATPEDLISLVRRYDHLQVCLDIGHLRVAAEMLGMDEWQAARLMAPFVGSMHLWTTRGREDVRRYHHIPVHPSLSPAEGWIDVPGMLGLVLGHRADCDIVFEPNVLYNPDPRWQSEGMTWVRELVNAYRP